MQQNNTKPRIGVFMICTFFYWFTMYTYVPTMTPYLADLGISFTMIGIIGGSYGFAQFVLRIPLGITSDRLGKRKPFIIFGLAAGAVSSIGMFFTQSAFLILALRLLSGVSASAWVVFTVLFTGYFEKEKRASMMSYLFIANGLGLMLSKFFGGLLAEYYGHEYSFLLGGASGVIAIILSLFIIEKTPDINEPPSIRKLIGAIKNRNLLVMSLLAVFSQMIMHSTTNTFTSEAAAQTGADLMQIGLLATVASIPAILSYIICGKLYSLKNINVRYFLAIAFFLQVIGTLIIPFAGNMTAIYISTILTGFGCGICISTLTGFCTQTVEESKRSAAMGFFQATYAFGMFFGPVILGVFVDWTGIPGGFFAAAAFAVIGLVLTLVLLVSPQRS